MKEGRIYLILFMIQKSKSVEIHTAHYYVSFHFQKK